MHSISQGLGPEVIVKQDQECQKSLCSECWSGGSLRSPGANLGVVVPSEGLESTNGQGRQCQLPPCLARWLSQGAQLLPCEFTLAVRDQLLITADSLQLLLEGAESTNS